MTRTKTGEPGSVNDESYTAIQSLDENEFKFRWTCCLLSCCCITILITCIILIIVLTSIIPNMAQTSANSTRMMITHAHISNPTSNSVRLTTRMDVVNAGANGGKIDGMTVTVKSMNGTIGTMKIPSINVKANKGATNVLVESDLKVQNKTIFQESIVKLLNGESVSWTLSGNTHIHPSISGAPSVSISLTKEISLPAGKIMNPISSDFVISKVTNTTLSGRTKMSLTKTGIMSMELKNVSFHLFDAKDHSIFLGYANLSEMNVMEGFNYFENAVTTIVLIDDEKKPGNQSNVTFSVYGNGTTNSTTSMPTTTKTTLNPNKRKNNGKSIAQFLSRYLAGNDTKIYMIGPYFESGPTVIDGTLRQVVTNKGSSYPPSGVGGFETQTSMNGWPNPNNPQKPIRGGYSALRNDLDVSLRILNLSVNLYLHKSFGYTVDMGFGVPPYATCNVSSELSHMFLGHGIDKNDFSKTWIDIPPKSKKSFFVIGEPITKRSWPAGSINWFCDFQLGYDCCFSTVVIASACVNNLKVNGSNNAVLEQDFIATRLYSNMTVAINGSFVVKGVTYYQDFFPVYASSEIYEGFKIDAAGGVIPTPNCGKVTNYTFA